MTDRENNVERSEAPIALRDRLLAELARRPGQRASDLSSALGVDRREVNRCLSYELAGRVEQGRDYRWSLAQQAPVAAAARSAPVSEIGRLSRYYLECIGQDMDEGASTFSRNRYGEPDYAELPAMPLATGQVDWVGQYGVSRVLGAVRQDRSNLIAWLGYPVRLRRHRTPKWEGFFVEPILLWRIALSDAGTAHPVIEDDAPQLNARFLKEVALGDGQALAEESAGLMDDLGLNVPVDELPQIDDLADRLRAIRPDWDWKEELDPSNCRGETPLVQLDEQGIYNRTIVIPGKRSPFTQGLESELKLLGEVADATLAQSVLGRWLGGDVGGRVESLEEQPLIEVLPMNTEQRAAVRAALSATHTVVTGPPGTGKSQVVTNLLVNAAWRGMKVLFASKNNKAVDVVEARINGLGNRPVLLRLGKAYQERLAGYLTQLLAGNPSNDDQLSYEEGLERHRTLTARLAELDRTLEQTREARNTTDRLDAEAEEARAAFGQAWATIDDEAAKAAAAAADAVADSAAACDVRQQSLPTRLAWRWVKQGRAQRFYAAIQQAAEPAARLGVAFPAAGGLIQISDCLAAAVELRRRVQLAGKLVTYKRALDVLRRSPSFESIAGQRARLMEQVAQNSQRLWRDWVQLAPTRLTPAQRRDVASYAAALQAMAGQDGQQVSAAVRGQARQLQARVTELFSCWAITSLSAKGRVPFEAGYFDLVVIDEASQCDIASALPMLYRAKRSVIFGDPQQLRHISALSRSRDSELLTKHSLVDTRLSWMYSVSSLYDVAAGIAESSAIINLRDHHRSHADIIEFSNRAFYEGQLRVATRYRQLKQPTGVEPGVVWSDVRGEVSRPSSGGAVNRTEARAVLAAIEDLLVKRSYNGTVGVVTPFRAQAQLLQELVNESVSLAPLRDRAELLVDTVHKFQGDERDVMFFSPVVSAGASVGALGFLRSNGNLFNVAITRARGLLHVIGDRAAASASGIDYLSDFAAYVAGLEGQRRSRIVVDDSALGPDYPAVSRPERVSDWERVFYRALYAANLRPIPQYSVEQYDLDFALIVGDRWLNIEVDGERYHRSWTGELCLRDQLRNQRLIELGWEVKRFWVYEIRDAMDACVSSVSEWATEAKSAPSSSTN